MNDYIYDIETYPNAFTLAVEHAEAPLRWSFEISDWRNDSREIVEFLFDLRDRGARMVGFNNLGFDYPVLHQLIRMGKSDARTLYDKGQAIIKSEDKWQHFVNPRDRLVDQIDLFKIHHFDNKARATSLKSLEFNMGLDTIEDLPFVVGSLLTQEQIETLKQYNAYDVSATKEFYRHTLEMIQFREEMTRKHPGRDWINYNDTKIGKEYFTLELERAGIVCYEYRMDRRVPKQTQRDVIHLKDAILPWIKFKNPEFTKTMDWFRSQSITETKGVFKNRTATINGFTFVFGLGGIHGSVESKVVESNDERVIVDLDVTSYYPNLAITNGFYPAHLGQEFCTIYQHLFEQRKRYPKKSAESAMLKLALNGVYGDSNNQYSVFYDPLYTMTITLNGQFLLCLLAEKLMAIPGLKMLQINTDGLTVEVPRSNKSMVDAARVQWQEDTKLNLEEAVYRSMMIRDVNNYIGVFEDGSTKRKGAYEWKSLWHQDASARVVPLVAEKVLVDGVSIRDTVRNWPNKMDFMLRIKVPRNSYLQWGEKAVQNTSRYYVAEGGYPLFKWMPPLPKNPKAWRKFAVESGWTVQVCNDIKDATLPIDYEYYIAEVEKLCLGLA